MSGLETATARVAQALGTRPELYNVHSSFDERRAEVRLVLDRTVAAGLRLTPEAIAKQLRQHLGAEPATTFRMDDEERDVVVRARAQSLATLPALPLTSPSGERVNLSDVARVEVRAAPAHVERSLGSRMGVVTAELAPGHGLGGASRAVERTLARLDLPPGVRAEIGGVERVRRDSFGELGFAALLAIVLVYMVMASLFESLLHPFTILLTLPTAFVGVVAGLGLTGHGFSVPALLGVVMLAGIAVSNGILLVDVMGTLRRGGMPRREAIVEAGRLRLRPILMTSLTTILGVLPLAFGAGEGAGMRAPMAIAVAAGLTTSTFLTLVVIPVAYDVIDAAAVRTKAALGRARGLGLGGAR
jgi:HAE1 family hydrophobic/amphiphilic exporter-1